MNDAISDSVIRALLVEDDMESAEAVRVMLERRTISTTVFHSAEEALPEFSADAFDIVITDIRLQGMSGVDLLRDLRKTFPDFPVILLTGYDSLNSAIEAVRLGAQDYILKPLDSIDEILIPIQKAVHTHRLLLRNRALEERLRMSEARFRTVLENSIDIAFRLELETNMLSYVSPSARELFGCPSEELESFHISRFLTKLHPDDQTRVSSLVQDLPSHSDGARAPSVPVQCRAKRSDGEYCWLSINYRIVTGDNENPIAIVGTARDNSELRHIQEEEDTLKERLGRAERMESIGVLAGGVAHDLNNVMWSVLSLPGLLLSELDTTDLLGPAADSIRKGLTTIETSARRAMEIFRDLLALSRSGHYQMSTTDINSVIEDYAHTAEHEQLVAAHPEVTITTDLCTDTVSVNGSSLHLHRVILNLTVNALDAMPAGGSLALTTHLVQIDEALIGYEVIPPGEYLLLKVTDTGSGIHEQHLGKIFEPFYTRKELGKRSGTGLGLAVVHGVVKDHHGFVNVTSETGKGTEFSLYFPVVRHSPPVKPEKPVRQTQKKAKVLVVDDAQDHLAVARNSLDILGYDVDTATSGREAVKRFETSPEHGRKSTSPYDLLLLDMSMEEGFDGLDTYREILKMHPGQRCIIVSAYNSSDRVFEAQKLGAGRFVGKPYTPGQLDEAIQIELGKSSQ